MKRIERAEDESDAEEAGREAPRAFLVPHEAPDDARDDQHESGEETTRRAREGVEERSKRIIMMFTDADYKQAGQWLEKAGGHVKTALVMALTGLNKSDAEQRLQEKDGFIRKVLQESNA